MLRHEKAAPGIIEEMLDDYLNREDKDIKRLKDYGERFNIEDLINERVLSVVK